MLQANLMNWNWESPLSPVCPDDLGKLHPSDGGLQCLECRRNFCATDAIVELLPRELYQESSTNSLQLDAYGRTFSDRHDKVWHQPLRVILNRLGNGYLYSWAGRALEKFANGKSLSILDAACGDGILRRYVSSRHTYVGVDFSMRPLVRAQRHNPATYFRADLNHLPFLRATFNAVLSLQALQYLDGSDVALGQIARVLKPGGILLLTVPNDDSFKYRFQGIPQIQLQRFGRENLRTLLTRDFHVLQLGTQGFWLPCPKIPIHLPGVYPVRWGLSWTAVATPKK
jgi:SAM-dependent methyltransferase